MEKRLANVGGMINQRLAQHSGAVCLLLLALHTGLAIHSLRQHCVTMDEGGHVLSGVLAWEEGRPDVYPVNPPLVKALVALPVVLSNPKISESVRWAVANDWEAQQDRFIAENQVSFLELFFRARYVLVGLSVLGGWLIYRWSTQLFGPCGGLVSATLWALCPNVIAWAGVCTVDLGATVFGLVAMYAMRSYVADPNWLTAIWSGMALGLASLSKFTLLIFYPIFFIIWLLAWRRQKQLRSARQAPIRWRHFVVALVLSLAVINTGYAFEGTGRELQGLIIESRTFVAILEESPIGGSWPRKLPTPLPASYVIGLDHQQRLAESGPPAYLCGEWRKGGWWYFYLLAMAIKIPVGTLALGLAAAVTACLSRAYRAGGLDEAMLMLPSFGIFLLLSLEMRDQFSAVRYILPAFPFLFIAIGRVGLVAKEWGQGFSTSGLLRRFSIGLTSCVVLGALFWNGVSVCLIHPHYLSYFNELAGGPDNGWRYLQEANIDWGQDLLLLKRWLDEHPEIERLHLAYYGGIDPHMMGIDYDLPPKGTGKNCLRPEPGWYAVSVNFICGAPFHGFDGQGRRVAETGESLDLFRHLPPDGKIAYSIFLYHVQPES